MNEYDVARMLEAGEIIVTRSEGGEVLLGFHRDHPDHKVHVVTLPGRTAMQVSAAMMDVYLHSAAIVRFKKDGTEERDT
jgi:hypothetical protein